MLHQQKKRWSSQERLRLHLQPQELAMLASKGQSGSSSRRLPRDPASSQFYTPVRPRKPFQLSAPVPLAAPDLHRSASFGGKFSPHGSSVAPQRTGSAGIGFLEAPSDSSSLGAPTSIPVAPSTHDTETGENKYPSWDIETTSFYILIIYTLKLFSSSIKQTTIQRVQPSRCTNSESQTLRRPAWTWKTCRPSPHPHPLTPHSVMTSSPRPTALPSTFPLVGVVMG